MGSKTQAVGIIALEYHGGLLERFVGPKPPLPGATVMVPADVHCVLVAGDEVTKAYGEGPHELDLMDFNRHPSGQLYMMPEEPRGRSGIALKGDIERHLEIQIVDPKAFVSHFVVESASEDDHEVWKQLFQLVDNAIRISERRATRETVANSLAKVSAAWGFRITDFFEQPAQSSSPQKRTLRIRKTPFPAQKKKEAGEKVELGITHVWASSTMDLFGKGELTLKARVMSAKNHEALEKGDLSYDRTETYESPDGWLEAETWQELPAGSLIFTGLSPSHAARLSVTAEERDPSSTDSLGSVSVDIDPNRADFEAGPTQGGKRGHFIRIRGSLKPQR